MGFTTIEVERFAGSVGTIEASEDASGSWCKMGVNHTRWREQRRCAAKGLARDAGRQLGSPSMLELARKRICGAFERSRDFRRKPWRGELGLTEPTSVRLSVPSGMSPSTTSAAWLPRLASIHANCSRPRRTHLVLVRDPGQLRTCSPGSVSKKSTPSSGFGWPKFMTSEAA